MPAHLACTLVFPKIELRRETRSWFLDQIFVPNKCLPCLNYLVSTTGIHMIQTMYWKHAMTAVALGALSLSAMAQTTTETPLQIAKQFCDYYIQGNLEQQYGHLVSTSLAKAIKDAERKNEIVSNRIQSGKPPLGDGLPFQSSNDRGTCIVGAAKKNKARTEVTVSYDLGDGSPIPDHLAMILEKGQWKIDDILFAPRYSNSMRKQLKRIFSIYKF